MQSSTWKQFVVFRDFSKEAGARISFDPGLLPIVRVQIEQLAFFNTFVQIAVFVQHSSDYNPVLADSLTVQSMIIFLRTPFNQRSWAIFLSVISPKN